MKKFLKILTVYFIGIVCVFTIAWRVNSIDYSENNLVCEENEQIVCQG